MKWQGLFLVISLASFPFFTFSMTLGEVGAAASIQNTLNGAATSSSRDSIKKIIKQVEGQEQREKRRVESLKERTENLEERPNDSDYTSTIQLENLNRDQLDDRFNDDGIEIDAGKVNYTKGTAIFYKNNCHNAEGNRTPSSTCRPIPVLTNIKSVIFNYAHSRGEFKKKTN